MSPPKGGARLHEFPCKQHADFKNARYGRKHINLLLLDNCDEYSKIYGEDGRPLEHATISAFQKRAAKYKAAQSSGAAKVASADNSMPSKDVWRCSYAECGQEAADCWKMVGNKRTPIGTFFGLANPSLPRAKEQIDKVPNMRPTSLTVEVVAGGCRSNVQVLDLSKSPVAARAPAQTADQAPAQDSPQQKPRPWLMPHQIEDPNRRMGKRQAKAVNSSRSPIGNFAIFELPPKF